MRRISHPTGKSDKDSLKLDLGSLVLHRLPRTLSAKPSCSQRPTKLSSHGVIQVGEQLASVGESDPVPRSI